MVKIRLQRVGKKGSPSYHIVVANATNSLKGKIIEKVGEYHPCSKDKSRTIKFERIMYWIGVGAKPTKTVQYLMERI